jgi:hypothetical protein
LLGATIPAARDDFDANHCHQVHQGSNAAAPPTLSTNLSMAASQENILSCAFSQGSTDLSPILEPFRALVPSFPLEWTTHRQEYSALTACLATEVASVSCQMYPIQDASSGPGVDAECMAGNQLVASGGDFCDYGGNCMILPSANYHTLPQPVSNNLYEQGVPYDLSLSYHGSGLRPTELQAPAWHHMVASQPHLSLVQDHAYDEPTSHPMHDATTCYPKTSEFSCTRDANNDVILEETGSCPITQESDVDHTPSSHTGSSTTTAEAGITEAMACRQKGALRWADMMDCSDDDLNQCILPYSEVDSISGHATRPDVLQPAPQSDDDVFRTDSDMCIRKPKVRKRRRSKKELSLLPAEAANIGANEDGTKSEIRDHLDRPGECKQPFEIYVACIVGSVIVFLKKSLELLVFRSQTILQNIRDRTLAVKRKTRTRHNSPVGCVGFLVKFRKGSVQRVEGIALCARHHPALAMIGLLGFMIFLGKMLIGPGPATLPQYAIPESFHSEVRQRNLASSQCGVCRHEMPGHMLWNAAPRERPK